MKKNSIESGRAGFKPQNLKRAAIITVSVFFILVSFQIAYKIIRSSQKIPETVYQVTAVKAVKQKHSIYNDFTAVASGEPQIKVFSPVAGKFKSAIKEGTYVNKGDTILTIDRDIPGMNYKEAPVPAPASGMVIRINFRDKGQTVTPYHPAAEIAGMGEIKAVISAGSSFMAGIKPGTKADIMSGQNVIKGAVSSVAPFISTDDMSLSAMVRAKNEGGKIKPGDQVTVRIYKEERNAMFISDAALFSSAAGEYVYLIKDSRAVKTMVKTGHAYGRFVEITEGISEGETVAVEGSFKLNEGVKVSIMEQKDTK